MSETVVRSEGETLEEAKAQTAALIPEGSYPVFLRIVSDGAPLHQNRRDVTVEADSLDLAREKVRAKTPPGSQVTYEVVIEQGSRGTVSATSCYEDADALAEARRKVPRNAVVTGEKVCVPAIRKQVQVSAFDDTAAKRAALAGLDESAHVTFVHLDVEGKRGFLGLGRKPNRYTVSVSLRPSSVEVDYQVKAKIRVILEEVVKTKAVVEVAFVPDADALLAHLRAAAESRDGLFSLSADRRCFFESLIRAADSRVGHALAEYVRLRIGHADEESAQGRGPRADLLDQALQCLEQIDSRSVRGELIELIFDHVTAFTRVRVPDVFGRFTCVLRALATAFTPVVESSKVGWRDNDGYETWLRYEISPLQAALATLGAVANPVSTNLLHKLAWLPSMVVPRGYSDKGDPGVVDPTEQANVRQQARDEIARRGNPPYDFAAYAVDAHYA